MITDVTNNPQILKSIQKTVTQQLEILNREIDSIKKVPEPDQINHLLLVEPKIEAMKSILDDDQLGNDEFCAENQEKIDELRRNVDLVFGRFQNLLQKLKSTKS